LARCGPVAVVNTARICWYATLAIVASSAVGVSGSPVNAGRGLTGCREVGQLRPGAGEFVGERGDLLA
jgi:hypothetical protein